MKADMLERLRDVGCDHEPFTPGHSMCVCRLTNAAADEIERLRGLFHSILMLNVENPYSAQFNEMASALARSALSK